MDRKDENSKYWQYRHWHNGSIAEIGCSWNIVASGTICDTNGCIGDGGGDITAVIAGTGLSGGGTSGDVTLNADTTYLQRRVTGTCAAGSSIREISATGTVVCEPDDSGTGSSLWTENGTSIYYNSGNVGIGDSTPSYKLEVAGDISNTGWIRTSGSSGLYFQSYGGGWYMADSTWIRTYGSKSIYHNSGTMRTDGIFQVGSSGSTLNVSNNGNFAYRSNVLFANVFGKVGIGTTVPSQKLDVIGYVRGSSGLCIGSDCRSSWPSGGGDITAVIAGTGLSGGGTSGDVTLNADTTYLQRRVTGTCAAGSSIRAISDTGAVTCEVDDSGTGSSLWTENGTSIYYNSGNVGIGYSAPAYKLDVDGTIRATAFLYPSDISLKKNIEEIPNVLERVLQLKGVSFEWIEENEGQNKKNLGLIAQEVEKIFPEVVMTDKKTGLKSLEYANLISPLVEALKEQQEQIEELKKEVEGLKSFQQK